jgi:hypothetical protein
LTLPLEAVIATVVPNKEESNMRPAGHSEIARNLLPPKNVLYNGQQPGQKCTPKQTCIAGMAAGGRVFLLARNVL